MLAEIAMLAILGLRVDWRPDACERTFATEGAKSACEKKRDEGAAWAAQLAAYFIEESERTPLLPTEVETVLLAAAIAYRENGLSGRDNSMRRLPADRLVSREVMADPFRPDEVRESVCWTYGDGDDVNCQRVIVVSTEDDGSLVLNLAPAGEVGTFQLLAGEIPAGELVPWTGEPLPRLLVARKAAAADPRTNVWLGFLALARSRDYQCDLAEDPVVCAMDPWSWVGMFNTGRRSGTAWDSYTRKVLGHYEDALTYVCEHMPDVEVCSTLPSEEPSE